MNWRCQTTIASRRVAAGRK